MLDTPFPRVVKLCPPMRTPTSAPAEAHAPYANRAGPDVRSAEWLAHWLGFLIFFLMEPLNAIRLLRSGRLTSRWHERPDLPPGSTQDEAASLRGSFGTAIAWMCLRHGIGPGHAEWPELSHAIVAFGGSLNGFRAGLPPLGLQWWENPNVVQGFIVGFGTPASATAATDLLVQQDAIAHALPPVEHVVQAETAHARLPASWLAASRQQVFARAGPSPSTGPPNCPGSRTPIMSDARGRSMASPAILIRADRKSSASLSAAHAFGTFDPPTFSPAL